MVMAVGVMALSVVAVAYGVTHNQAPKRGQGEGACGVLMSDPEARDALQQLRNSHQAEMQRWFDRYGADASSEEARGALEKLRDEHRRDMQKILGEYGIIPRGARRGGGMMGGRGCDGACGGSGMGRGGYDMMGGATY
jgi:hypothetical protein